MRRGGNGVGRDKSRKEREGGGKGELEWQEGAWSGIKVEVRGV